MARDGISGHFFVLARFGKHKNTFGGGKGWKRFGISGDFPEGRFSGTLHFYAG
jgi:hypothetical protein